MAEQPELMPAGISRKQFSALVEYASKADALDAVELLRRVRLHVEEATEAHSRNRIVNLRLATAIARIAEGLLADWTAIDKQHRHWLGGAILYFADCRDHEHDFSSAIGFEDDAEVLNACLKFAGHDSLCLNVEEFDDA